MKFKTSISNNKNGEVNIRGKKLSAMIGKSSFADGIFLLWRGTSPKKNERSMLEAILLSCIEHGVAAPSAFVPRVVASTGNSMNASLAAGILSIGDYHGGAIEGAARLFQSGKSAEEIVGEIVSAGARMPGYGHKVYKDIDPRAQALFDLAKKLKVSGKAIKLALEIRGEFEIHTQKKLPINIDGAIAAIITDLCFDWRFGKAFFVLGRIPGMAAHVTEELVNEKPYRRLEDGDVEYSGK